jgi:hypothetical protein
MRRWCAFGSGRDLFYFRDIVISIISIDAIIGGYDYRRKNNRDARILTTVP